jgi:DNA-directed RNA polymerase specialized sigma24 family protein
VCTRCEQKTRAAGASARTRRHQGALGGPLDEVAAVAAARRDLLLRVHRHRLRREDLEDSYSQATLELLAHVRAGGAFAGRAHIANALEQRFLSRVTDRRRAVSGRSPMQTALERAAPLGGWPEEAIDLADARVELERLVILRHELRRIQEHAAALTYDQRLVLACQIGLQMQAGEFCRRYGWSLEKYRKVAQRGRARLRALRASEEEGVPPLHGPSEQSAGTNL